MPLGHQRHNTLGMAMPAVAGREVLHMGADKASSPYRRDVP